MQTRKTLSETRINRLRAQGYEKQTESQLNDLAFGNRFAYAFCTSLLIIGVATANIPVLSAMLIIAFLGVVLPNHPFDYIFNGLLSKRMGNPKVGPRSPQLKFACSIATLFIGLTIYLFSNEMTIAGYLVGGVLITVAGMVSTIDLCIPSITYNKLFRRAEKHQTIVS